MKKMILLMFAAAMLSLGSCKKCYTCKDANGQPVFEKCFLSEKEKNNYNNTNGDGATCK